MLAAASLQADGSWPSYRNSADNAGAAAVPAAYHAGSYLKKEWIYRADSRITGTPTLDGGLLFTGTWNGDVIALDARRGAVRWTFHLGANSDEVYGGPRGVIGSVALAQGTAYAASGNCMLAALDERDGHLRWRVRICDNARNDDVYASPVVLGGMVLVGVDLLADRPTDRGRELAIDARTGRIRWSFEPARYQGEGAGVSATPALDLSRNIAYVGTGNPLPRDDPPPGPDPGSDSIYALDAASGKALWVYGPVHPHDVNDEDLFASPNLITFGPTGHRRTIVGEGGKDGAYYAVDAANGAPLWKTVIPAGSASASIIGTSAFSDDTIFVSVYDGASGSLTALRVQDGAVLWHRATGGEYEAPLVVGDAVFTTEITGRLDEFAAGTGKQLGAWSICAPATGRGPSSDGHAVYVASGKCVEKFSLR
jgi:outer membrane protein assembly factor BamB